MEIAGRVWRTVVSPWQRDRGSDKTNVQPNRTFKIFISYSRADIDHASKLVAALEGHQYQCMLDTRDLPYGQKWRDELSGFIRDADIVIFLVSQRSIKSQWCNWEIAQVLTLSKRLVPLQLEAISPDELPPQIAEIQVFPWSADWAAAQARIGELVEVLQTDRAWTQTHTRLTERAEEWHLAKLPKDLLLRGSELRLALAWVAARPDGAPPASQRLLDFLMASQSGADRRRRIISAIAGVFLLILGGLSVVTWNAARERLSGIEEHGRQLLAAGDESGALPFLTESLSLRRWIPWVGDDSSLRFMLARAVSHLDGRFGTYWPPGGRVDGVAISPDERQFLSFQANGDLRLWDIGKARSFKAKTDDAVIDAVYAPSAVRVVTLEKRRSEGDGLNELSYDITRSLIDASNGSVLETYDIRAGEDPKQVRPTEFPPPKFSADGKLFFIREDRGSNHTAYSTETGNEHSNNVKPPADTKKLRQPPCNSINARDVVSNIGETEFLTKQGTILRTSDCRRVGSLEGSLPVKAATLRASDSAILTAQRDAAIMWKKERPRAAVLDEDLNEGQTAVFVRPDSATIAIAQADRIELLEALTRKAKSRPDLSSDIKSIEKLIPLSSRFVARTEGGSYELWDSLESKRIGTIKLHKPRTSGRDVRDDEMILIAARKSDALLVKQPAQFNVNHRTDFDVYSTATGKRLSRMSVVGLDYDAVAFSHDGKKIFASASDGSNASTWVSDRDSSQPDFLDADGLSNSIVRAATFSQDDARVVAMGDNRLVYSWDTRSGKFLDMFPARLDAVTSLSFSPGGKYLLANSSAKSEIIDFGQRTTVGLLEGTSSGDDMAFSPDERFVVTTGPDEALRIYEASSGRLLWLRPLAARPTFPARWHPTKPIILVQTAGSTMVFNASLEDRRFDEFAQVVRDHHAPPVSP